MRFLTPSSYDGRSAAEPGEGSLTYIAIKDYVFDLGREADAALVMFPQLRDTVFFVSAGPADRNASAELVCHGPAWDKHKNDAGRVKCVRQSVLRSLSGGSSCAVRSADYPDLWYVVINLDRQRHHVDRVFSLDHELGHQLVPEGYYRGDDGVLHGESAADAFGAIRCIQRFGPQQGVRLMSEKAADRALVLLKAASRYTGDWEHMTTQVIAHVVKDEPSVQFENLGPKETIDMADHIAQHYALTPAQAKEIWRRARDLGDGAAGEGTEEKYYEDKARNGGAADKFAVGKMFFRGGKVKQDQARAVHWFLESAQRQYADAQCWLGYCYRTGAGVPKNFGEAFRWYRLAADQGNKGGMAGVAECYYFGEGTARNDALAVDWYKRAAAAGDHFSMYRLSEAYADGHGLAKDPEESQRWLVKAAEAGSTFAQMKLGEAAADLSERRKWYAKAAEGGSAEASRRLGTIPSVTPSGTFATPMPSGKAAATAPQDLIDALVHRKDKKKESEKA